MKTLMRVMLLALLLAGFLFNNALAQTYYFSLDKLEVHVYVNEDGTASLDYVFVFTNSPSASPIDYVDVGLPNGSFADNTIVAYVDGRAISDISRSGYMGDGTGVAVGLGSYAIKPGKTGTLQVFIGRIEKVLYEDSDDANYASIVFSPTWFGKQYMYGKTDMRVAFHLPPGVLPEEPKWHAAPSGWPAQPETYLDDQGRVVYLWHNPEADSYRQYLFGASFPMQYVPAAAIVRPSFWEKLGINPEDLLGLSCCAGFFLFFAGIIYLSHQAGQRRRLQYMPPKIAIEGLGIKRGLTAVEAAILMEQPLDKVLTMILFGVIKKGAATVVKSEPLEIQETSPLPEGLQPYELQFLEAFREKNSQKRKRLLQEMMIALVRSISEKMKGFSRRETVAYYQDIVRRAWAQVEAAQTPEVRSEKFDQYMEWTMLDKDYEGRTREVFRSGPVIVPTWWGRYDPGYGRTVIRTPAPTPASAPAPSAGGKTALPHLPGSDFAASIVNGVQRVSAGVVGNLTEFTGGITDKTNPVPVATTSRSSSYRSGGGGRSSCACACACACAGCACACAGGGR